MKVIDKYGNIKYAAIALFGELFMYDLDQCSAEEQDAMVVKSVQEEEKDTDGWAELILFDTEAELNAYWRGVSDAGGWNETGEHEAATAFSALGYTACPESAPTDLVDATYVTEWDNGITIRTKCRYSPSQRTASDIVQVDIDGVDCVDREYIILPDGTEIDIDPFIAHDDGGLHDAKAVSSHIHSEARRLYMSCGASAVYDYANRIGIKDYIKCGPCDADTPHLDQTCLVCGTVSTED